MNWLKKNWKQAATLSLSLVVGAALHFHKITPDEAIGVGAVLATLGIHLPKLEWDGGK